MDPSLASSAKPASTEGPVPLLWNDRPIGKDTVAAIFLIGSTLLLILGVAINYVLTGGQWYIEPPSRVSGGPPLEDQFLDWKNPYDLVSANILIASLLLLGFGFLWRGRIRHGARALGFVVFGFYWATQAMKLYEAENGDFVNAAFAMFAVYFFNYFAYHELVSFQRNENPRALHWLTGTAFLTTGVYFATHKVQPIAEWLILVVADQTQWLLRAFGQPTVRMYGNPDGSMIYYPVDPGAPELGGFFPIQIILACTAVQSIMIFVGGILALQPPRMGEGLSGKLNQFAHLSATYGSRRVWSLLLTIPLIYVLNLFRNVIIIWMSGQEQPVTLLWMKTHEEVFWFSHNVIGKGGSLVALIIIAFIVFQILPELYDSIIGLLDLKERRGPLETWFAEHFGKRGNGGVRAPAEPVTARPPSLPVDAKPEPHQEP